MFNRAELEKIARLLGGVLVARTFRDGLGARCGVRAGDIVTAVDGVPTPDLASFLRARTRSGRTVDLELYRSGRRLRVRLDPATTLAS